MTFSALTACYLLISPVKAQEQNKSASLLKEGCAIQWLGSCWAVLLSQCLLSTGNMDSTWQLKRLNFLPFAVGKALDLGSYHGLADTQQVLQMLQMWICIWISTFGLLHFPGSSLDLVHIQDYFFLCWLFQHIPVASWLSCTIINLSHGHFLEQELAFCSLVTITFKSRGQQDRWSPKHKPEANFASALEFERAEPVKCRSLEAPGIQLGAIQGYFSLECTAVWVLLRDLSHTSSLLIPKQLSLTVH